MASSFLAPALRPFIFLFCGLVLFLSATQAASNTVVTVSAASFEPAAIAPDSLASAFGSNLATTTAMASDADPNKPGVQLPTQLGGTTVRVGGLLAELLFVSPLQINFVVPTGIQIGVSPIQVIAGDGIVTEGTIYTYATAVTLFTANADGQGVVAANVVRVNNGVRTEEAIAQLDPATNQFITRPIIPGAPGERIFLEIYCTGIHHSSDENFDGNVNENILVAMGGHTFNPTFAGRHPFFVGLDQINIEIPPALFGRGKITLAVQSNKGVNGVNYYLTPLTSNIVEIELGSRASTNPPQITAVSQSKVAVGDSIIITGQGFSLQPKENTVRVGGVEALVESASESELRIRVPFGAASGKLSVTTAQGEGKGATNLIVNTSLSGLVEAFDFSNRAPLRDVKIRLLGTNLTSTTSADGVFTLLDVPAGEYALEVDANTLVGGLTFPKIRVKVTAVAGKNTLLPSPILLEPEDGTPPTELSATLPEGVIINVAPFFLQAIVSPVPNFQLRRLSSTPVPFASITPILQITPIDAQSKAESKLVVSVTNYTDLTLWVYRYDQDVASPTFGQMILQGSFQPVVAGVSPSRFEIPLTVGGYYAFADRPSDSLGRLGSVSTSIAPSPDEAQPFRNAYWGISTRTALTDGSGSIILRNANVEVGEEFFRYLRADGRVIRQTSTFDPVKGYVTDFEDDAQKNRAPFLIVPVVRPLVPYFKMKINETQEIKFYVGDADGDSIQSVSLQSLGINNIPFATLLSLGKGHYVLRLQPGSSDFGKREIGLQVVDSRGGVAQARISLDVSAPKNASCCNGVH